LKYRDKQLLRLKDEILDLEDFTDGVALNEFTLDDFRMELVKYLESNRALLEDAPLGLYTVVPPDQQTPGIMPGVIFCLRQEEASEQAGDVNPLQPHFLVYVRADGNVRFGFAQPKQILEIYRILCSGKTTPHDALCDLFDKQTQDGRDMTAYGTLLRSAITSIARTFRRRAVSKLLEGRSGVLLPQDQQATESSEFELITWLVIN